MAFFQLLAILATAAAIPLNQDQQVNETTTTLTVVASHSLPTLDYSPVPIDSPIHHSVSPVATETVLPSSVPPPTAQTVNDTNPDIDYESTIVISAIPAGPGESGDNDGRISLTGDTLHGPVDYDDDWLLIELYNGKSEYIPLVTNTANGRPKPVVEGRSRNGMYSIGPYESLEMWVRPTYEGMIALAHVQGSKIEVSYSRPSGFVPHADVSYVDGFSHEVVCSCNGRPVTGCNKNLSEYSECPSPSGDGTTCLNPAKWYPNGPADEFFAPCQGSAYTFPNDNAADRGCPRAKRISCCIGPDCDAPANQLSDY